jgi:hypothetical protein
VVKKIIKSSKIEFSLFGELIEFLKSSIKTATVVESWFSSGQHFINFKPIDEFDEFDVCREINLVLSSHPKFKQLT